MNLRNINSFIQIIETTFKTNFQKIFGIKKFEHNANLQKLQNNIKDLENYIKRLEKNTNDLDEDSNFENIKSITNDITSEYYSLEQETEILMDDYEDLECAYDSLKLLFIDILSNSYNNDGKVDILDYISSHRFDEDKIKIMWNNFNRKKKIQKALKNINK